MKFLTNWKINIEKIPAYFDFNHEFKEEVDYYLAKSILDCEDERLTDEIKMEFKKLVDRINPETNMLPVRYSPRYKIGRRYPDCPDATYPNGQPNPAFKKYYSALISQPRIIKNTIFYYQGWVDLDQKKGHPTLLLAIAELNGLGADFPIYKKYLEEGYFDKLVVDFANYYNIEPEKNADEIAEMTDEEKKEYYSTRIDKKDIKWLFNKTIYGGGHTKWVEDIVNGSWTKDGRNICKRKPKELKNQNLPHPFYNAFKRETQKIIDLVFLNNDALTAIVCKDIVGGQEMNWKRKNRVMSYFCGVVENELTYKAYKYLVDNHLIQKGFCDWGLDGITFPSPAPYTDFDFHLNEMNEYVRKHTGLKSVTFVRKAFEPDEIITSLIDARRSLAVANVVDSVIQAEVIDEVSVETQESSVLLNAIIEDDNEGAEMIFNEIKDRFKFCSGNIFFKEKNVWVNSKQKVDNHLIHFILTKTNLSKMSGGKSPTPKPYSTNVNGAKAILIALYARLIVEGEDNTLIQKFITTTRGRLCFLDGILDFTIIENDKKGKFYKWEDVDFDYYTPVQIERNFAEYFINPNLETIETIKTQIFTNLFGVNDCDRALAFFARGVAGHFEDKAWSLYIGNRNCGKGVVDCLAKSALGAYHANVESQNLLCNSSRTLKQEQPEKQMAFALDFQFSRLTFSQELPPPPKNKSIKVSADIIKRLISGGDPLKAKRNYDVFITEFINQSRLIVMANDCPTLTNDDALQTCCEFNSTLSFKSKKEIDDMIARGEDKLILEQFKVGDPLIKDKCKTEDWANAFIMLMLDNYQDFAVVCADRVEVVEENDKLSLRKFIITAFEVTKNDADFLKNDFIRNVFENGEYGDISSKKISIELKAMGLKADKRSGGVRGWLGIKMRPPPEVTDEQGKPV